MHPLLPLLLCFLSPTKNPIRRNIQYCSFGIGRRNVLIELLKFFISQSEGLKDSNRLISSYITRKYHHSAKVVSYFVSYSYFLTFLALARHFGPNKPSLDSTSAFWYAITAASVSCPKLPSTLLL